MDDMNALQTFLRKQIRFDRNELSGAFGDMGTDIPLVVGLIAASGLDGAQVLIVYGIMQVLTALIYGIPMPVQPLKAVAVIVITQKISGNVIWGGGFSIGVIMLLLTFSGLINFLSRLIPMVVIRGVQMGLGIQLGMLALQKYIPEGGISGYVLSIFAFFIIFALLGNRRLPPAFVVIFIGILYGIFTYQPEVFSSLKKSFHFDFVFPKPNDILTGFFLLAIPQIPLSLANSILATEQLIKDYFPEKTITSRKIAVTYSLLNIISSMLGGIPVCHGSGGMAGHYTFGARTGGSVLIYGLMFITFGLVFGGKANILLSFFPLPLLGVLLLFEALALLTRITDVTNEKKNFLIALIVGLCSAFLPYGYIVGMTVGAILYYSFSDRAYIHEILKYVIHKKVNRSLTFK